MDGESFFEVELAQQDRLLSCSQAYSDSCRRGRPIRSAMAWRMSLSSYSTLYTSLVMGISTPIRRPIS